MTLCPARLERLEHERRNVQIADPAAVGDLFHDHVSLARHAPGSVGVGLGPAHAIEVRCGRRLDRSGGEDESGRRRTGPTRSAPAAATARPPILERGGGSARVVEAGIGIPLILSRRARRRASMRTAEPRGQKPRRLRRCRSVERHERGRNAGRANDVGAPPILGHAYDFDQIGASPNGFFKTMHGVGHQLSAAKIFVVG